MIPTNEHRNYNAIECYVRLQSFPPAAMGEFVRKLVTVSYRLRSSQATPSMAIHLFSDHQMGLRTIFAKKIKIHSYRQRDRSWPVAFIVSFHRHGEPFVLFSSQFSSELTYSDNNNRETEKNTQNFSRNAEVERQKIKHCMRTIDTENIMACFCAHTTQNSHKRLECQ